ncbi:MAG TPA: agmatinase family protein, partial [Pseudonocardiaceae bacterium]|nr:agmatinase family protein [Pseudonocardiaceae bacterium]
VVTFGVLSVPFDHAVSHRPGARLGPEDMLAYFNEFALYCTDKRVSLRDARFVDLGEVDVVRSLPQTYANVADAVRRLPDGIHPIFLGGDHSITDPLFRTMQERAGGRLGLVDFDAHFDSREPLAGKEHSGHWMKTLEDVLDYRVAAQLGISSNLYSEDYMRRAEDSGVLVRTVYDLRRQGWRDALAEVVEHVGRDTDGVYISVDIDCIDQAFAGGTSTPNPSGLFAHEVIDAVFEISAATRVVGLDIAEVSPPLEGTGNTARVGAYLMHNHVAGTVRRLTREPGEHGEHGEHGLAAAATGRAVGSNGSR